MQYQVNYDPEFLGGLWYLDHINEIKITKLILEIKDFEFSNFINRISGPHICKSINNEDVHFFTKEGERYRLRSSLIKDSIEHCAKGIVHSYKQLPIYFSCLDSIYNRRNDGFLYSNFQYSVCCYSEGTYLLPPIQYSLKNEIKNTSFENFESRFVKYKNKNNENKNAFCFGINFLII